jgi:uncharacterized coiled-coil protein SlyX
VQKLQIALAVSVRTLHRRPAQSLISSTFAAARTLLLPIALLDHPRRRYAVEAGMPSVEERVSNLEGKVSEQSNAFVELRTAVGRLEQRMDARFAALDDKVSRQFYWIIGIQITILIAMLGVALSRG